MGKTPIKRPAELEYTPQNCHAREMLVRIGDKWSVYVIHLLDEAGTLRFNERMLTVTLRGMERDGLVIRKVYPEVPPRVEYSLTSLGKTLRQLVRGLVDWSGAHLAEVDAARAAYDARHRQQKKTARLAAPAVPLRRATGSLAR